MSRIHPLRQHLPNLLTMCNLALGSMSVIMAFENQLLFASWLILMAALFDFLDGFAAKLLRAVSEFGKQLDSLADIISFGMAPASIVYKLMEYALKNESSFAGISDAGLAERIYMYSPMFLVLFAAIRLAAYNIQDMLYRVSGTGYTGGSHFFCRSEHGGDIPSGFRFHFFLATTRFSSRDHSDHQYFDDSPNPDVLPEVPRIRMEGE